VSDDILRGDAAPGGVAPRPWPQRAADAWSAARRQPARVAVAALAAAAIVGGLWWLLRPPAAIPPEQLLPRVSTSSDAGLAGAGAPSASESVVASTVVVHVSGAVTRPGVLHLPLGTRVIDAVDAAGGLAIDADTDRVNLAAPLVDGGRVHVPRIGEVAPPIDGDDGGGGGDGHAPSGPIDINTASPAELESLPGIGPATARAIIEHRERHGPFASVDALGDVSGIGDAKLAQLRDLVRV
jgi:competence protein ComEA